MPMSPRLLRPIANNLDPDAAVYLNAVAVADGQQLEPAVRKAINDFVVGCKRDGIWDAIKASCILMGARTLSGALTPLVGSAPTNNNFVSGDYNRKTGLVGDASTKYLNSNRTNNADPQDSNHNAVYLASVGSGTVMGGASGESGANTMSAGATRNRNPSPVLRSVTQAGFYGMARSQASSYVVRFGNVTYTETVSSTGTTASDIGIFGLTNAGSFPGSHRIAFYSIGESLTLSLLDDRITTLYNAIAAAI